ncbi:MAG TPA: sulfatase [Pirellulales bacterium]|nr:sulfatase [Pirellulales bacterium]
MICRLAAFVTLLLSSSFVFAAPAERLNIVLFLADDLGWADVGCYGADLHETPHLDRLARQSLRFTQAYAGSSVCTPTRAALMTGKHPARLGMTIWAEAAKDPPPPKRLVPPPAEHNLSRSETTVASYLSKAGYLTAIVGKWHLGDALHYPETHGFDVNIGGTLWGAPHTHFYPYRGGGRFGREYRYVPHLEFGQPGEYLTDRLTDEALQVIDRAGDRPFFLYLAHHAVHTPIEAKAADVAYFEEKLTPSFKHQNAAYAAMVRSLDESVGRVLQRLDERGLTERTLFIFTSDNGGFIGRERAGAGPVTNNYPVRSGKGALYEGGVRVPLMVRWPGVTSARGESAQPVVSEDLFFTILEAAGIKPAPDVPADGLSLVPILKDPSQHLPREALYFHYPHYYHTTTPVSSVRAGDWKLLEFYEDGHRELYNLADDLGEQHDLAQQQPERTRMLAAQLAAWQKEVGARLPRPAAGKP